MSDHQDTTTPFNEENTKLVPDTPGIWFYHATHLPVTVVRKEDGELYFQGGMKGEEEMKVTDFAKMKAKNPQMSKYFFTKFRMPLMGPISNK